MPGQGRDGDGITRRRFVRDAGVAAVVATGLSDVPALAAGPKRRPSGRLTVAVFGGGVAGLTAAHELAERGFDVTVYERRGWGGKARSMDVPGTARGGRKPLPAEHGFREILPGYRNLPDTMRRIPSGSNANGVLDNLVRVPISLFVFARDKGRPPWTLPAVAVAKPGLAPAEAVDTLAASLSWLPPSDVAQLVSRLVVFLASGRLRRYGHWEYARWEDFIRADRLSEGGRLALNNFPTRFAAQSLAGRTSARTLGAAFESVFISEETGRFINRIPAAPTNEAWIDPWRIHLRSLGVHMRLNHTVTRLHMRDGKIAHATVRTPHGAKTVKADWYIVALPVDWATKLWNRDILAADPHLARSLNITKGWMVGIQLYLREPRPIAKGHFGCLDSPWAIAGISQAQFWKRDFPADYGDGTVKDKFSAVIIDWETPGILFGKKARDCTDAEIAQETWAQLKAHLTYQGAPPMPDDLLAGWYLDPGMRFKRGRITHYEDPLPRSDPGGWNDRHEVTTQIPNLSLASDYLKVDFDISSMEGANEAARRAVNAILDRAGSKETPVHWYPAWQPPEWAALRQLDDERYRRGQPNLFDADLDLGAIKRLLGEVAV